MKAFRIVNFFAAILMVIAMLPQQQVALAQASAADINRSTKYVPGEVLVDFGPNVSDQAVSAKAAALSGQVGAAVTRQSGSLALLSFSPDANVPALAAQILSSGQVVTAQPNYIYWSPEAVAQLQGKPAQTSGFSIKSSSGKTTTIPWDQAMAMRTVSKSGSRSLANPTFPNELPLAWGWNQIQADLIWPNKASTSLYVCLLDTGVDGNQPDLKGSVLNGPDEVNADSVPNDDNGHGTAVAGVIAGKLNNGVMTAAGVYNGGKIVAVKVLNSQGYGTSFNVAAGLTYCTTGTYKTQAKIINISLGSSTADPIEYKALLAAKNAGKLIVAAAGNDSSSDYVFPAAWALQNVDQSGTYQSILTNSNNTIYNNVIAVAGGGAPNSQDNLWVDWNSAETQGSPDPDELFNTQQCASSTTNYGDWISLVAPGENILTSTPTSYPFALQAYNFVPGYAYFSGTSMAAGFASGAAAEVWSLTTTLTGALLKSKLVSTGTPLTYAVEGYAYTSFDPTIGYSNPSGAGTYGDVSDNAIYAPYCWPGWTGTPSQPAWIGSGDDPQLSNMEAAPTPPTYLNVAAAMNRTGLYAQALDAITGQPLAGASITASLQTGTSTFVLKDTSLVPANGAAAMLINLPLNASPATTYYQLSVSKSGYTVGAQPFDLVNVTNQAGTLVTDNYSTVSVPPSTNLNLVLNWIDPGTHPNLDLYLWLPNQNNENGGLGGIIGHSTVSETADGPADLLGELDSLGFKLDNKARFLAAGTLLPASAWGGTFSPYAIHNFNGEIQVVPTTPPAQPVYYPPMESISILGDPTSKPTAKAPMLKPFYDKSGDTYTVMVADNSATDENNGSLTSTNAPILRIWAKGYLVQLASPNNYGVQLTNNNGCDGSNDWWNVLGITGFGTTPTITINNTCGGSNPSDQSGDPSFLPYGVIGK